MRILPREILRFLWALHFYMPYITLSVGYCISLHCCFTYCVTFECVLHELYLIFASRLFWEIMSYFGNITSNLWILLYIWEYFGINKYFNSTQSLQICNNLRLWTDRITDILRSCYSTQICFWLQFCVHSFPRNDNLKSSSVDEYWVRVSAAMSNYKFLPNTWIMMAPLAGLSQCAEELPIK